MRDFKLIPVVLIATACLFALKVLGLALDGGYTLADVDSSTPATSTQETPEAAPVIAAPATIPALPQSQAHASDTVSSDAKRSWMQGMFNFSDITGASEGEAPKAAAAEAGKGEAKAGAAKPEPTDPPPSPGGTVISVDADRPSSPAERALLEHLQARRQELDARARELDIRDNLVKEAERRLDSKTSELKDIEARITAATQKKDEADVARLKGLIVMYENMKPKDAAKVFDRLDLKVLIDLASNMNPRRMSDILAQMQPDTAERLTVELANKGTDADKAVPNANLPKIDGKPTNPDATPDGNGAANGAQDGNQSANTQ
jgi:flagellar motility protein MotE (MotC chaperone)